MQNGSTDNQPMRKISKVTQAKVGVRHTTASGFLGTHTTESTKKDSMRARVARAAARKRAKAGMADNHTTTGPGMAIARAGVTTTIGTGDATTLTGGKVAIARAGVISKTMTGVRAAIASQTVAMTVASQNVAMTNVIGLNLRSNANVIGLNLRSNVIGFGICSTHLHPHHHANSLADRTRVIGLSRLRDSGPEVLSALSLRFATTQATLVCIYIRKGCVRQCQLGGNMRSCYDTRTGPRDSGPQQLVRAWRRLARRHLTDGTGGKGKRVARLAWKLTAFPKDGFIGRICN